MAFLQTACHAVFQDTALQFLLPSSCVFIRTKTVTIPLSLSILNLHRAVFMVPLKRFIRFCLRVSKPQASITSAITPSCQLFWQQNPWLFSSFLFSLTLNLVNVLHPEFYALLSFKIWLVPKSFRYDFDVQFLWCFKAWGNCMHIQTCRSP